MPWTNQDLVVYHGTLDSHATAIRKKGVNVALGRMRSDFGRGFYTTTIEAQARKWAQLMVQRSVVTPAPVAAVIRFELARDQLAALDSLWFVRGTTTASDYWDLIGYCRTGGAAHARALNNGWYDAVVGPLARARWSRRRIYPGSDQISFHTPRAARLLNACPKRVFQLTGGRWRKVP